MESFFERMTPWRKPEGSLHLYVLPGEDAVDRFTAAQAVLEGIDHLPLMPQTYLHCTLQRLSEFDDQVSQRDFSRFGEALSAALSTMPAFDLTFGRPHAGEVTVEVLAEPSRPWDDLLAACRRASQEAWDGALPNPPHAPHLSLAYATGDVDSATVAERLAGVEPIGAMHVDTVHLVSVTVRPERGTFDFTSLANWELLPLTP